MSGSEFQLIQSYFSEPVQNKRADVILGIGDDCAIVEPREKSHLVFSIDTLISGVHFPQDSSPDSIAYKALSVNLSDLAAMGAEPAWFTLSLSLPDFDKTAHQWLEQFSKSLFALSEQHNIQLIGGDTTRGALSVTIQVCGYIKQQSGLKRSGAIEGDVIAVTGSLGAAAIGLDIALKQNYENYSCLSEVDKHAALQALNYPCARVDVGLYLQGIAHSALDLSDGLYSDLGHILNASGVAAIIELEKIPLASSLDCMTKEHAWEKALTGGDDYELCFTLAENDWQKVVRQYPQFTAVGRIVKAQTGQKSLHLLLANGKEYSIRSGGYDHFA
ncbi:MAG: thiamine-phosphate kinase [gamma proteobacterium symbiont of Taylorina sp.]|nr:thiamine-phosphate kinase [gamma proteobacterium symbiont of Taylorina sp.]